MMATLIQAPPYGSTEWLVWRRGGLGASELAAVVGCDPWKSEYQVAAIKRGTETEAHGATALQRWGLRMESVGIDWYREQTGHDVVTGETWQDPRYPHLWASLDGRAGRRGVEVKYAARWTDLPQRVEVQALGQSGIADLEGVDVVRLSPYGEPTIIPVDRDDETIADLLALGESWYTRFVLGDEWPALDDSPAARKALSGLRGTDERIADEDQRTTLANLRQVRDSLARLEAAEKGLVRDLKASMAGVGVLVAPDARVTWSAVKGRTTVGWQQVAQGLRTRCTDEEWEAVVSLATTVGDPGDRFLVKFEDEEEAAA